MIPATAKGESVRERERHAVGVLAEWQPSRSAANRTRSRWNTTGDAQLAVAAADRARAHRQPARQEHTTA